MKLIKILFFIIGMPAHATVVVPVAGNSTFNQPIHVKVFDRATGTFFVGLNGPSQPYTISAAARSFGSSSFTGIATTSPLSGAEGIDFLTLATSIGNTSPILATVLRLPAGPLQANVVVAATADGNTATQSPALNDASGAININGLPTAGIVGLAASQFFMFPALKPCGGNFGADCNGGIASVSINQLNLELTQVSAQEGDSGIKAKKLDATTPELLIGNSPTIAPNTLDMHWDDQLQRLYIGLQLTTAGTSAIGSTCAAATGICVTGTPPCPTGLYYDNALAECVTCPQGGIFNPNSNECQPCPEGQLFDSNTLQCETVICPHGQFFNPDPDVLQCVTCPPGQFFNTNTLQCENCPNEEIYDPDINSCTPCPSGTIFDPDLGICVAQESTDCPPGMVFAPEINSCIFIEECDPGFHFDVNNLTCIANEPGEEEAFPIVLAINPFLNQPLNDQIMKVTNYGGPRGLLRKRDTQKTIMATRAIASGGKSVIVARVDAGGSIEFKDIAPDSSFALENTDSMVGVYSAIQRSLTIHKVRVLHASTGPSYLIINGGNGTLDEIAPHIYALPLVDLQDPADPDQGTLAAKNSPLTDFRFTVPATTQAELPQDTEPAVQVGGGPLALSIGSQISDIDVVGDTVYVSIAASPSALSEGGILYSQALFDQDGKILRWTPWTQKAFPPFSTSAQPLGSAVTFFAVDALTSKVWAVDDLATSVVQTAWFQTQSTPLAPSASLVGQLNAAIEDAATAVLDLDQSTRGFLANQSRYALFAGDNKIIFTRISQSFGAAINSPQQVISDFSLPTNFKITSDIPGAASPIQTLEYARQLTGSPSNYFFAGTQNGLYVFSVAGNGFDVSTMGNLSAPPFSTGAWSPAPNIPGTIVAIKTTGNALYVLAQTAATITTAMQNTLYRIAFAPTIAAMFAPGNIVTLATTGTGTFAATIFLTSIEIISTQPSGSTEQIVLGTNNGLYRSSRPGGIQAAINQTDAAWQLIPDTLFFYNDMAAIDTASIPVASPSTIWPFYFADQNGNGTFGASVVQQLNGTTDAGPFNFVPAFFNSITATTDPNFAVLPQITYFWSDGARRLAIVNSSTLSCLPQDVMSLPFNTLEWDIQEPEEALLSDTVLDEASAYFWIKQIGVSGLLMVGTNQGVMALG